ncbi:Thiolase, N-terminal domain-containing protein [Geopyxis carbonaria]|nr:Thiolase, N-terminal domain-containing protein [Geopyxis carbonaria]
MSLRSHALKRSCRMFSTTSARKADAYILAAARTATGKFNGGFKDTPAPVLGSHVVKEALSRANIAPERVNELYFGHVLQASAGQSPARQVGIFAGLPDTTEAVTINKVCASGLKAVAFAAQQIQLGLSDINVAGGMENMSLVPYYVTRANPPFGDIKMADGLIKDGLTDVYGQIHMGVCAENTAKTLGISRVAQDNYAIQSYTRAAAAWKAGKFAAEIVPVEVKTRKGVVTVQEDEEYMAVQMEKIPTLRPAFVRDGTGTITAANASSFSDGASAVVLGSAAAAKEAGVSVMARIVSHADAATKPIDFPLAPTLAIPLALKRAGLEVKDIAKWEINEAFAAVSVAIGNTLGLDESRVNVNGGAIALGHALGSSGSRILTSLLYELEVGEFGVAAICNGGGGATAMVVQRVDAVE